MKVVCILGMVHSGPIVGGPGKALWGVFVDLDAGDRISVIPERKGAEGVVTAMPEGSELLAEVR